MKFDDIIYSAENGIATITINRAQARNAVRPQTYEELTVAFGMAGRDNTVGVVVLTGAGDKAFCAGGDVKDQKGRSPSIQREHLRRVFALSTAMRMIDKPVISKVRGWCVGAGNEIHVFCDLSVASDNAKFGQVGPRVGAVPVWGACQLLSRLVGERKARVPSHDSPKSFTAVSAIKKAGPPTLARTHTHTHTQTHTQSTH